MSELTLHVIGLFHTVVSESFSHCAYTMKVMRFPKMMRLVAGDRYKIIEYSNGTSESQAHEHVKILDEDQLPPIPVNGTHGENAVIGTEHWRKFDEKLKSEMLERVKESDFIIYPFGNCHSDLQVLFPNCVHTELTGIGYPNNSIFSNYKVFESSCWYHTHLANANQTVGQTYSAVIYSYQDTDFWKHNPSPSKDYVLFFGRIGESKGCNIVREIAMRMPHRKFLMCGQGDPTPYLTGNNGNRIPNLEYREPVSGVARYELVSNASCMLVPTAYVEPFANTHAESMLCGTPVIASNRGVFLETVKEGKCGFVCRTLGDYMAAVDACDRIDREKLSKYAMKQFGFEACGKKFVSFIEDIRKVHRGAGWYQTDTSHHLLSK